MLVTLWGSYLNVIEAGRRLKIHPETVKRLCRQGDLPASKIHNTWLIDRDILDNLPVLIAPDGAPEKK